MNVSLPGSSFCTDVNLSSNVQSPSEVNLSSNVSSLPAEADSLTDTDFTTDVQSPAQEDLPLDTDLSTQTSESTEVSESNTSEGSFTHDSESSQRSESNRYVSESFDESMSLQESELSEVSESNRYVSESFDESNASTEESKSSGKAVLNEFDRAVLEGLLTDDYQHGLNYPGEPNKISLSETEDLFNLCFAFTNTDADIAEEWVTEYLTNNGFVRESYELFSKDGLNALAVVSFSKTEAGFSIDYEFTNADLEFIGLSEDSTSEDTGEDVSVNEESTSVSETKTPKRVYQRKTITTVLPATATSKQIAATLAGMGIKGSSNRVTTLDSSGNRVSAAKQVMNMVNVVLPNIKEKELAILTDTLQCKKLASLGFPLFMRVNPALTYKQQATVNGRYRYSRTIVNILGNDYYVTNHLFARNVAKVEQMFKQLNLFPESNATANTSINASQSTSASASIIVPMSYDSSVQDVIEE